MNRFPRTRMKSNQIAVAVQKQSNNKRRVNLKQKRTIAMARHLEANWMFKIRCSNRALNMGAPFLWRYKQYEYVRALKLFLKTTD